MFILKNRKKHFSTQSIQSTKTLNTLLSGLHFYRVGQVKARTKTQLNCLLSPNKRRNELLFTVFANVQLGVVGE